MIRVRRRIFAPVGLVAAYLVACSASVPSETDAPDVLGASETDGGGLVGADGALNRATGDDASSSGDATVSAADASGGDSAIAVNTPIRDGKRCHLHLHWAGGSGKADSVNLEGVTEVWPQSPGGAFWLYDGPHDYSYDPTTGDAEYQALVAFLTSALVQSQCGPTIVIGYSNGGGLAAKLFCKGEDFGGRAWGYIVSDPVMDDGVRGCKPSPNIRKTLFTHSDELRDAAASAGNSCTVTTWYCQDNRTMPLAEYEMQIGRKSIRDRALHGGAIDPQYAPWSVPVGWWKNDF